jgi:hypothetical protein
MPGTIFISHRAEYASLVRELKKAIETTSRGQIDVIISENLSGAEDWREAIKSQLQSAKYLFLVYGAPYEDWSWCFYEAGYFAGTHPGAQHQRSTYCIARPKVDPPGPLSDLQMVTDKDRLIAGLIDIYKRNNVEYDAAKLRESINQAAKGLFGRLEEFVSYPRVYFIAKDADFAAHPDLPAGAVFKGDPTVLTRLFGIGRDEVPWTDIVQPTADRTQQDDFFFSKWLEETKRIILAARRNRFIPPQTVLVRGSQRVRFLLYVARCQGDGVYCCEFLVIDEVGGPALGLPQQQLALLTSVRMGFRFRYEFIKRFAIPATGLSDDQRRTWIREIPRIIDSMLAESHARGNITLDDLQNSFGEYEADRIGTIVGYWEGLKEHLYGALGLSPDGKVISDQGLIGPNLEKYRLAFEALRLSNIEFLSRCCARVSGIMTRPEEELQNNARIIDERVLALGRLKALPAPRPDSRTAAPDEMDVGPLPPPDPVGLDNRPHV